MQRPKTPISPTKRQAAPTEPDEEQKPETDATNDGGIEGEGSYSATHRYNAGLKRSLERGDSEALAKAAEKALEGKEGEELRRAEKAAKQGKTLKAKPGAESARHR
jgi:hypothetical protein